MLWAFVHQRLVLRNCRPIQGHILSGRESACAILLQGYPHVSRESSSRTSDVMRHIKEGRIAPKNQRVRYRANKCPGPDSSRVPTLSYGSLPSGKRPVPASE